MDIILSFETVIANPIRSFKFVEKYLYLWKINFFQIQLFII